MCAERGSFALVLTGLLLMLVCAAPASAWDRPVRLTDSLGAFPDIDGHGTIRVLQATRRHRVEAALLRWGKRRYTHCGVPGIKRQARLHLSTWSTNGAGQMLFGWALPTKRPRYHIASAAPGRCFRRRTVIQRAIPRKAASLYVVLGPLGTMVAGGTITGRRNGFEAVGPIGGPLGRRPVVKAPRKGLHEVGATTFIKQDRQLRLWLAKKPLAGDGEPYRETLYASVSAPRAGRPGKVRRIGRITGHESPYFVGSEDSLDDFSYVTSKNGGQVAGGFARFGFWLMSRRPGRPFGKPHVFHVPGPVLPGVTAAGNGRGDAVFAWEAGYEDVYALVRRRNGKVVGPTLLSPGSHPSHAAYPSVGIDGAGRAIVAYVAQGADQSQLVQNQILVAFAPRGRGFGTPASITGPEDTINRDPHVLVSAHGHAALWFRRYYELPDGINLGSHNLIVRKRLGR